VAKLSLLVLIVACCLTLHALPAYGCRYNVREVGFIDVGIEPYYLFVYLPAGTSPAEVSELGEAVDAVLMETNIRFEPVIMGADANHPALEFVETHSIETFPAAVLVSPDGQSMPLPLPNSGQALAEAVSSGLEAILHSPTRQEILEKAADNYGVVLLLEGPQPQLNTAAREAVSAVINRIGEQLEYLPKPIARPPALVALGQESLAREHVLLWMLGLTPGDVNEPHAAVFYGRGRWMGPLFKGQTLTPGYLGEVLSIVGADCECGLDHRWLQGTMLPARWDETLRQKTAESLGFDPESPMVKMEMVSIVRRGMGGFDYPGVPFGYREVQIGDDEPQNGGQTTEGGIAKTEGLGDGRVEGVPPSNRGQDARDTMSHRQASFDDATLHDAQPGQGNLSLGVLAASLGGMTVIVAAVSIVILLRAKKA
jgi:hypothetical protein